MTVIDKDVVLGGEREEDPATAELRGTIRVLRHRLTQSQEEVASLNETIQQHQAWKLQLIKDLHDEADNREMCDDFDDFMTNHGMPRRDPERDIDY